MVSLRLRQSTKGDLKRLPEETVKVGAGNLLPSSKCITANPPRTLVDFGSLFFKTCTVWAYSSSLFMRVNTIKNDAYYYHASTALG